MGTGEGGAGKSPANIGDFVADESIALAAEAVRIPISEIRSPTRERAKAAFARQIAIYIAHCTGRISIGDLAAIFKRDRTTIAHAIAAIEDRRDDAFFNAQIDIIEADLRDRLDAIVERCKREAERARARGRTIAGVR